MYLCCFYLMFRLLISVICGITMGEGSTFTRRTAKFEACPENRRKDSNKIDRSENRGTLTDKEIALMSKRTRDARRDI